MRRAGLIPLVLSVVFASRATAQWQATAELGFSRLEQRGLPTSNAQSLGATIDALAPFGWFRTSGIATYASGARLTAQGVVSGALVTPAARSIRGEFGAALTGFAETNVPTAHSAEVLARALGGSSRFGASLGLGGGVRAADDGDEPLARALASAWVGTYTDRFSGDVSFVRTTSSTVDIRRSLVLTYTDGSASWRHERKAFSAGATIGVRTSNNAVIPTGAWGSADATVWIAPRLALVASGGRSPVDVVRGVPQITYASVSIKLSAQNHAWIGAGRARAKGPQLVAAREGIELRVERATTVELMADFTDWTPVALERGDGVWRLQRAVSPGLHRLAIRIDGGEWTTPANLPTVEDDLGGRVALLTVP
jgi:hypothetical protein